MKGFRENEMAEFRVGANMPVVALDIDGTLGDYHKHFLWFAEQWLGQTMPDPEEINPGMRLSTFMGIPHHIYQECKLAYRQGGLKRFMPVYPYAAELTGRIRAHKAQVWLCTTRPYLRLDNIDPDTREWLHRNQISYDAILFEGLVSEHHHSSKYHDLVRQIGTDRIVAAVDDLPEEVDHAIHAGIQKVYIRDQPYNREPDVPGIRVINLEQLAYGIVNDLHKWQVEHG